MKFLIVSPRFHTNLYYRVKALQDAGHRVKVVVLYKGESEFYENIDIQKIKLSFFSLILIRGLSIFSKTNIKSGLQLRVQAPSRELSTIIQQFKPQVILLKAFQNALALKTLIYSRKLNIQIFMLTQTTKIEIFGSAFLFKLNIKLFQHLGVKSYISPIKENFNKFKKIGIDNIYYIPFVFPDTRIKKNIELINKDNNFKILSIGKFVQRKDQLLLCKAIKRLIDKGYSITLTIFGEKADRKYYNEIKSYIINHKLENYISLNTNIAYDKILEEYKKHHIFVLPSHSEPAAYSIVEAMAFGLPVICSDQNGTKCYIEEGINGWIFKAKNMKSLYKKIENSILNKYEFQKMQIKTLVIAKENHALINYVKLITNITQILP